MNFLKENKRALPAIQQYQLEKELGAGAFGKVYKAIDKNTEKVVALKQISKSTLAQQPKAAELLKTEIKVLKECKNINVIAYVDDFETNNHFIVVTEYCKDGDLEQHLEKKKKLSEKEAIFFLKQLVNGFKGLHEINVLHRDFKLSNIFLNDMVLKIGDLGFAKQLSRDHLARTCLGSSLYMAPEVLEFKPYNNKADIWSLGVVFYQLLFGDVPYDADDDEDLIKYIKKGNLKLNEDGVNISDESRDLIRRMLVYDPAKRINWTEIYDHPLLKKDKNASLIRSLSDFEIRKLPSKTSEGEDIWSSGRDFYAKKEKENNLSKIPEILESNLNREDRNSVNDEKKYSKARDSSSIIKAEEKMPSGIQDNPYSFENHDDSYEDKTLRKKKVSLETIEKFDSQIKIEENASFITESEKKESVNKLAKQICAMFLHERNKNCIFSRILTTLQQNPRKFISAIYQQYFLAKKIFLEGQKLLKNATENTPLYPIDMPQENIKQAFNSVEMKNLIKALQEDFTLFEINYQYIKEEALNKAKNIQNIDKEFVSEIKDSESKSFPKMLRTHLLQLFKGIFNELKGMSSDSPNYRAKLVYLIEIANAVRADELFKFDLEDKESFDFQIYEEGLEYKSMKALKDDLDSSVKMFLSESDF